MDKPELTYEQLRKLRFTAGMYSLDAKGLDAWMAKRAGEGWFDPNKLTVKELFALDSRRWDDNIIVLPIWTRNFFGDGVEIVNTKGEPVVIGRDEVVVDFEKKKDGLLNYGVLKEAEEEPDDAETWLTTTLGELDESLDSNDPDVKSVIDKLNSVLTDQKIDSIKFK